MTKPRDWYLSNLDVEVPRVYETSIVTAVDETWYEKQTRIKREISASRPFVAWDGEGINLDGPNKPQSYCLFGTSSGSYISSKKGLSTKQCFQLMMRVQHKNRGAIHVGFSIGYDAEMIFRDIPHDILLALTNSQVRWWGRYRIWYCNKKWLEVTGPYLGKRVTCRIYDIWSFFGCSFIDALETFLPDTNKDTMRRIMKGKFARGDFTVEQLDTVMIPYWTEELECVKRLVTKLRILLHKAGLFPSKWHGPAALANYLNVKHKIAKHMNPDTPDALKDASQFAYAAGRVENHMVGRVNGPAWKYDRNSAYPSAMVDLPSLSGKKWRRRQFENWQSNASSSDRDFRIKPFGLYFVDYEYMPYRGLDKAYTDPQPFFHRTRQHNIVFPHATRRWMWGVEIMDVLPMNQFSEDRPIIQIIEAMELSQYTHERPYAFVQDMYDKRLEMKRNGQEEQVAIKLGLNSLYGKMAQQKGYSHIRALNGEPWNKQMPWHQFEWAGFVTAHNRRHIFNWAFLAAQRGILIAIETDAIFTSAPMPELEAGGSQGGDELGKWGSERFDDIVYLQNGVYMTYHDGPHPKCKIKKCTGWHLKYRGFDKDSVKPDGILKYLEATNLYHHDPDWYSQHPLEGSTTRFIGAKLANTRAFGLEDDWRVWRTEPKQIVVGLSGKRWHNPEYCRACQRGVYYGSEAMHDMSIAPHAEYGTEEARTSFATVLPWRNVKGQADKWMLEDELDFDIDGIEL